MKILASLCVLGLVSIASAQVNTGIGAAAGYSPRSVLELPAGVTPLGSCVIATPCPYGPCVLLTPCPASAQTPASPVQAAQQPSPPTPPTVAPPVQVVQPPQVVPVIVQVPEARCQPCPCPAPAAAAPKRK
jgi:hypothetical protein